MLGHRRLTSRRGLTLVELLVALVLLAVVLLPVMVGFSQALVAVNQSSISAAAASIARDKMEELKRQAYLNYDGLQSQERQAADFGNQTGFFEVEVTVPPPPPNDPRVRKQAVVSVYRTGSASPTVTLTSYFTPRGV